MATLLLEQEGLSHIPARPVHKLTCLDSDSHHFIDPIKLVLTESRCLLPRMKLSKSASFVTYF